MEVEPTPNVVFSETEKKNNSLQFSNHGFFCYVTWLNERLGHKPYKQDIIDS